MLFLTGPAEVWRWLAVPEDLRRKLENGGLIEMSLHRWTADVTQAWKKEAEFGVENPGDLVRFQQATGLWCHFLHEVGQQCVDRPHEWETIVTRYAQSLTASDAALSKFELVPDSHAVLRALADYGEPVTLADLEILTEERAPAWLARRVLEWAERLRFIERGSHESWTLDPFLQRLLVHGDHGT